MAPTPQGLIPTPGVVQRYLRAVTSLYTDRLPAWDLVTLEPLLDSADMQPSDWERIAQAVVERHHAYDGFVVLHGTDTMVYTASALSFLLRQMSKPIVFTGAQLPLGDPRSDGRVHMLTSLTLAARTDIPEVTLYFGGLLFRANRAQKVNNRDFVAYASGNLPPLARVGTSVEVSRHLLRPGAKGPIQAVRLTRSPAVGAIRVYPGMSSRVLAAVLDTPMEGVVLETYGAGTFPSDAKLLGTVADAVQRGVVVVNCSQCHRGRVNPDLYGTGVRLSAAGVVSGQDMTPEAALTKLYCLLGTGASSSVASSRIGEDLAGELTPA
jgi:L-asparaginase